LSLSFAGKMAALLTKEKGHRIAPAAPLHREQTNQPTISSGLKK